MAESDVAHNGPEEFLRGALEKIVFLECRVSQLNAELTTERAAMLREKEAAAVVRAREVELEMLLAQARSTESTMKMRIIELEERVRLLESERELFMAGFVDRAKVVSAPGKDDDENPAEQTDLAALSGFIAELREKIEQLKLWKSAAQKAGIVIEESSISQPSKSIPTISSIADHFEKAGRLGTVTNETNRIKEQFATQAERSLYQKSMRDLESTDPACRKHAADCLGALGSQAASPLITAALDQESSPEVKVALLRALEKVGEPSAVTLAIREIADQHPEVRAAALDTTAALAKEHAQSALVGALSDSSSFVRRRAVLLLSFIPGSTVTDSLTSMLSDPDQSVARVAALALSGRPDLKAQSALVKALNHEELVVRRCAADAVKSWSGEVVDPDASSVERRRAVRKVTDKLTKLDEVTLRKAVMQAPIGAATADRRSTFNRIQEPSPFIPIASKQNNTETDKTVIVKHTSVPVVPVPEEKHSTLEDSLIGEIRTSLRGRTAEELSHLINAELPAVTELLTMLVKKGTISQRGPRFFMS